MKSLFCELGTLCVVLHLDVDRQAINVIILLWFQARLKEAASLEKHVILKKLRDSLEALRGRVGGKNSDDVAEAIAIVSYLDLLYYPYVT